MKKEYRSLLKITLLFVMMYMIGLGTARGLEECRQTWAATDAANGSNRTIAGEANMPGQAGSAVADTAGNWGLGFGAEGEKPTGNTSSEELAKYDAYYVDDTEEKVLYLTFDAGFENGNTGAILDALKKHGVSATFFVVGNYLETEPELVKRMVQEGHTVGNHSYHHPDMTSKSREEFEKELTDLENAYEKITGQKMTKFYRPPQGKYNAATLEHTKQMGYRTFFWSLAYVDWLEDKQPSKEEAFDKLTKRMHPGAIVLLHSTSATNAQILDELLGRWEEMGYQIRPLTDIS